MIHVEGQPNDVRVSLYSP